MPKFEGVYRAGNGSWYFKASLGRDPLTGKRIQLTKRGFATASEAARARREALEAADDGSVRSIGGGLTVDELLDLYLDGIDADGRLSAKTPVRLPAQRGRVRPAVAGSAACPRAEAGGDPGLAA